MSKQKGSILRVSTFVLTLGLALIVPLALQAQPLPSAKDFVTNLDVRCYQISGQPPLNNSLRLDQLNPALGSDVATQKVTVLAAEEVCVPVYKNSTPPPNSALPFMKYVDWGCYKIDGGVSLDLPIHLEHLNPVILQNYPGLNDPIDVVIKEPQQLCLPIRKNTQKIPSDVLKLIQWLDVECFRIETQDTFATTWIQLHHLNPLYAAMMPEWVTIPGPKPTQLCLPVMKNRRPPTDEILKIVQYSDVLCYEIQAMPLLQDIILSQLNPVLLAAGITPVQGFVAQGSTKFCVPVAKNGFLPPG